MTSDPPLRILIVDDEPANVRLIIEALRDYGFDLMTALNGEEGLVSAREGRPDLILLDIRMPGLDGLAVCARLKADPATQGCPILFLTALTDTQPKLQAFQLGAVDYITKPFDPAEVLARVLLHLDQHRIRHNLQQRLDALERAPGLQPPPGEEPADAIQRVAEHLRAHLADAHGLDDLARLAHTNRSTLNQRFQDLYGLSVFDWLREQRLLAASALLRTTRLQVTQIAERVGYTSHAGLSGAFRERFGASPSEYRRIGSG